ncbi:hypothetical protein PoB_007178500 [Plakobranchus ocellatus]|uniref:Uncharacterized protein n=1 Tax=Plakobranchus ocellatus TaxID=259542 RepID=A0AAV4DMC1_9GAST|nr:hypothetical protein PoB_007178500 [Plakobranchus ocellatus]
MNQPVVFFGRNLPYDDKITNYDIYATACESMGRKDVCGAHKINDLWRVYLNGPKARINLLINSINGNLVEVCIQNPLLIRGSDGREIPRTKLIAADISLSVANEPSESDFSQKWSALKIPMESSRNEF